MNNGTIALILPWTCDPPCSIQVLASRGILDDLPPPIYHAQPKLMEFPIKVTAFIWCATVLKCQAGS